jgi:hypothetical protein
MITKEEGYYVDKSENESKLILTKSPVRVICC